MDKALRSIRYIVMAASGLIAASAFFIVSTASPLPVERAIRLEEFYAWTAVAFLYVSLLATPLIQALPDLPIGFRVLYIKARRALGVSAFLFALLHGGIAFFVLLGGFSGLNYLTLRYLFAVSLGFAALVILMVLAATSRDSMVRVLGRKWKMLHRLAYGAAVLILLHAIILGSHLGGPHSAIAQIFYVAVIFLLALEALRIYRFFHKKYERIPPRILFIVLLVCFVALSVLLYIAMQSASVHPH